MKKQIYVKNLLHNLHEQISGFYGFIFNLECKRLLCF